MPTERAKSLVAYLINLKDTYAYPETFNVFPEEEAEAEQSEAPAEEGH